MLPKGTTPIVASSAARCHGIRFDVVAPVADEKEYDEGDDDTRFGLKSTPYGSIASTQSGIASSDDDDEAVAAVYAEACAGPSSTAGAIHTLTMTEGRRVGVPLS